MKTPDSNDLEFHNALGALHSLVLGVAEVETFLAEVAGLAAAAVDEDVSCGITTRYDDEPVTSAASDARASAIDEAQYASGSGPCLEALSTGLAVDVGDQESDHRWGAYREAALTLGVKCSLSLPLFVDKVSIGALNLYGYGETDRFSSSARQRADVFAAQASTALTLALRFNDQEERSRQLVEALHARSVIDQAIGVLMAGQRCDGHTAFDLLRQRSQSANRKLRDVATELVERASGHPVSGTPRFEQARPPSPG